MNKCVIVLLIGAVANELCSARYLPKKEFINGTSEKWQEVALKVLSLINYQDGAAVEVMTFIQEHDIDSAEMDTNTEWKEMMLTKCAKLAQFDDIVDLDEYVGEIKWSDVEKKTLSEKLDYWNSQYMTLASESRKMQTLKNMCILITEDAKKKHYADQAKRAGLSDDQSEALAKAIWEMNGGETLAHHKAILADYCDILGGDGKLLEIDEDDMPKNWKWSDVADTNITIKMDFWFEVYLNIPTHSEVAEIKALKNLCFEFMCPMERKKIEDLAKEAGFPEEHIPIIVDMEIKMNMNDFDGSVDYMIIYNYEKCGKHQYEMKVTLTEQESKELESEQIKSSFWKKKYHKTTGIDHLKSLKNYCTNCMKEIKKLEMEDRKSK